MIQFIAILLALFPVPSFAQHSLRESCEVVPTPELSTGYINAVSGSRHKLFWKRLKAPIQPSKGTAIYLAGGPLPHFHYLPLARELQQGPLSNYDILLYDYSGIHCSSRIRTQAAAAASVPRMTMPAMVRHLLKLKRELVGTKKVLLIGGSFGAMLGAAMVARHPEEIESGIFFSGDTETGWFANSWQRFEKTLIDLTLKSESLAGDLDQVLSMAENSGFQISVRGRMRQIDREMLEVMLFMSASASVEAQEALASNIKLLLLGQKAWLESLSSTYFDLLKRVEDASPTSYVSVVTMFHRCNVWFPPLERQPRANMESSHNYLHFESLVKFWNKMCKGYDPLGDFSFDATPDSPTRVPLLVWTGDRDFFDPADNLAHWRQISTEFDFNVMAGWSHDFGPHPHQGLSRVKRMISNFLKKGSQ